jgi:hypothetical protein
MPPAGKSARPAGAATLATDHVSEGFRPDEHQAHQHRSGCSSNTLPTASTAFLLEEVRRSLKPHLGATGKHPPTPQPRQHDGADAVATTKKRGGSAPSTPPQPLLEMQQAPPPTTPGRDCLRRLEAKAARHGHRRPAEPLPAPGPAIPRPQGPV